MLHFPTLRRPSSPPLHPSSQSKHHHRHSSVDAVHQQHSHSLTQQQRSVPRSSFQNLNEISELSAERLNLYIDRQEASARQHTATDGFAGVSGGAGEGGDVAAFRAEPKTSRERWKQRFRIALPHIGLVFLSAAYTLLGAAIFHHFETPFETHIRNATSHRVQLLKDRIIAQLWTLAKEQAPNVTSFDAWSAIANSGMNAIIRDVFIDYTKNYMTPDDIIRGAGPTKWSFGSSVFFSWTAITTIGYGHIVPRTLEGRISCLLYALFGIPLILVTIADMGRFLSGGIIWVHSIFHRTRTYVAQKCRWFFRHFCCRRPTTTKTKTGKNSDRGRWWWFFRFRKRRHQKSSREQLTNAATMAVANDASLNIQTDISQLERKSAAEMALSESKVAVVADANAGGNSDSAAPPPEPPPPPPMANHIGPSSRRKSSVAQRLPAPGKRGSKFRRGTQLETVSESGTFEDISEIHTQLETTEKTSSTEDTHARADDLISEDYDGDADEDEEDIDEDEEDEFRRALHQEHRVSVLFILVVMLGYTAGGACLMQLWERWDFVDAFYFCFVTVTTIGFGDIVPQNVDFLPATLCYIVVGLIITTMCIDLVGSEYIRDIHFYGRSLGRSFLTIGGKVVHLGEVFSYVAFLQKNYGLTPDQLDRLAQLPEEYLLDCMINGRQPDLNWIGGRPYIPPDIYYFKWIEQPRTLSFTSERVLASVDSELDLNTSRCSTARTLTPREYYQRILVHYCKQMQQQNATAALAATGNGAVSNEALAAAIAANEAIFAAASRVQAKQQDVLFGRH